MTDDLITWLRAQLDTDEQSIRTWGSACVHIDACDETGDFMERFGEDRMLAEVDAKRRILDRHRPHLLKAQTFRPPMLQCEHCADLCHSRSGLGCDEPIDAPWPCPDIRDLTSIYADRPGCREEWKPA